MRTLRSRIAALALILAFTIAPVRALAGARDWFRIEVVDATTGRGVPLVELRTVNHISHWTDNNGLVAFHEPGLMNREVFFHVSSHGYSYPADGFGQRGVRLTPVAGQRARIAVERQNLAERLYRITGQGLYRDSLLVGERVPLLQPALNAEVTGQDTVIVTPYRGRLYWFWGDTDRAAYPLGHFAVAGATSKLPGRGGLPPEVGIDLDYFTGKNGFSRPMCPGFGEGLHWIEGIMTVPDETGRERLIARVSSQKGLMAAYAWHIAVFDDRKEVFESQVRWNPGEGHDSAHPFRARVAGTEYIYLYPNYRVRADFASVCDPTAYEAFTCVQETGDPRQAQPLDAQAARIDRDRNGQPQYRWRRGALRPHAGRLREWIRLGLLRRDEAWLQLRDIESGSDLEAGRGSVFWNDYRQRWVALMSAQAGEIWFAEADTPTGPWVYARRVVRHDDYNFYNPTQHPFFDQDGGRTIYFEGTYTASFSAARAKTPRYDYNQILYRLRLDIEPLALPVPVYAVEGSDNSVRYLTATHVRRESLWDRVRGIAFFALPPERGVGGTLPIYEHRQGTTLTLRDQPPSAGASPLFFGLPWPGEPTAASLQPAAAAVFGSLHEIPGSNGPRYQVEAEMPAPRTTAPTHPLCRVWLNPMRVLAIDPATEPSSNSK